MMDPWVAEVIGTGLLLLLGNGVVANAVLRETKGHSGGWVMICLGWGMAVFVAVWCTMDASGAHLNPAVTVGLAAAGMFAWDKVPAYVSAQLLGALIGAALVYWIYRPHYFATKDPDAKLATFCTGPAIRQPGYNFLSELAATFVLVFAVLMMPAGADVKPGLGALGALPVGLLVMTIGLTLGGPTGYAINPARDFSPRLAHALLPMPDKRDSDWSYAWIPVLGPLAGGLVAAALKVWVSR